MACRSRPGRTGLPLVVLVLLAARAQAVDVQIDSTTYTGGEFYVDDGAEIAKVRWTQTAANTGWVLESQSANSTAWFAVLTVAAGSQDVTGTDFHLLDIVPGEACQACPDGFTSLLGGHSADDCVCPAGAFKNDTICEACDDTSIKSTIGNEECTPCYSLGALFVPSDDRTKCVCERGTYKVSAGCVVCSAGKYSASLGANAISTCEECPAGTYSPPSGGAVSCTNCPAGKYSDIPGIGEEALCVNCVDEDGPHTTSPAGSNTSTACVCRAGYGFDADQQTCGLCSTTKHKPSSGDEACTPCPAASSAIDDRTRCQCGDGYYGNLAPMQRFRFVLLETNKDPPEGWYGKRVTPNDFFVYDFRVDVDDVDVSIMCESKIADALAYYDSGNILQFVQNTNIFCELLPTDIPNNIFYVSGSSENFDGVVFEFNLTDSRPGFTYRFDNKPPGITINQNTAVVYPISWRIEGLDPVEDEWVTVHEVQRMYARPADGFTTGGCQSCGSYAESVLPRVNRSACQCLDPNLLRIIHCIRGRSKLLMGQHLLI